MKKITLPIDAYCEMIKSAILNSKVVVIEAETGAGKSLRVPQMIRELGFEVCVTEPRRIAAVSLANYEACELDSELGDMVGYATGFEKCYGSNTEILYATDGLQLVREINEKSSNKTKVLVIDEVHEWNLQVETLVAWAKYRLENDGWDTRVVIMSATMESQEISKYFGGAEVISVKGRTFPVSYKQSNRSITEEVVDMVNKGKNTLVFLPGKNEIEFQINEIKKNLGNSAVVLPLHAELSMAEQQRCFDSYDRPLVICATNIAQTSLTPPVNAVVSSGQVKIVKSRNGIESLTLSSCSKADLLQQMGRAGRLEEGQFVLCNTIGIDEREEYTVPEILRLNLEQVVLRLAAVGIDAETLNFFHQPSCESIIRAKEVLKNLGALDDAGKITEMGKKMSYYPVDVRGARMLVESEKLGVLKDVIIITAILSNGSLINWQKEDSSYSNFTNESKSDLIAERDVWNSISGRFVDFKKEGINSKIFFKVKDYIEKLTGILRDELALQEGKVAKREDIITACVSGMVDLMHKMGYKDCYAPNGYSVRRFDRKSCVEGYFDFCVGFPRTIEYVGKWGFKEKMDILSSITAVDFKTVRALAPHLFKTEVISEVEYYPNEDKCYAKTRENYFELEISNDLVEITDSVMVENAKQEYERRQREYERLYSYRSYYSQPKRQTEVSVDGKTYYVSYNCGTPSISMHLEDVFETTETCVKLDKGEIVNIYCVEFDVSSNNIPSLKNMIETKNLNRKFDNLKRTLSKVSVKSYDDFVSALTMLGSEKLEGIKETLEVFKCLSVNKNDKVIIDVVRSGEEAKESNDEAIRFFLGKEIEKRFNMQVFFFVVDGKRTLTNKGSKAKSHFESEKLDVIKQITPANFEESMEYLQLVYDESVDMLNCS